MPDQFVRQLKIVSNAAVDPNQASSPTVFLDDNGDVLDFAAVLAHIDDLETRVAALETP